MSVANEVPLFITDPHDGIRKNVGTLQTHDDGSVTWYKRISPEHVMRLGSFGFDAMTYDTHFRGKTGTIRLERIRPDDSISAVYVAELKVFDKKAKANDYGHGRQYFLPFSFWATEGDVSPKRAVIPERKVGPIIFGEVVVCPDCRASRKNKTQKCVRCGGRGVVANVGPIA